jgi:hypothetical protein
MYVQIYMSSGVEGYIETQKGELISHNLLVQPMESRPRRLKYFSFFYSFFARFT